MLWQRVLQVMQMCVEKEDVIVFQAFGQVKFLDSSAECAIHFDVRDHSSCDCTLRFLF